MKTTLLIVGAPFLLLSCIDTSNTSTSQNLPDDEMKARTKAEAIHFEKSTSESDPEITPILMGETNPIDEGRCTLPKGELSGDLIAPPEVIACPKYPPDPNRHVFDIPEIDAQYPGGALEIKKFINSNLRYPEGYATIDAQETVYVSFVVEKDGSISNVEVVLGIEEAFDQEALRVVESMPKWIPGEKNGKVVAARVRLPIHFTLILLT